MLARITYLLVVVALGCLIGGFFTRESNVLLFVSIGLSVVAIALVLVGWARRAREAPVEELAYVRDDDLLSDEELAFVEDRPARRATATRPRSKPKAAKPKAKPKATAAKRKPAKPAARKPKAKPKTTARKPQARPKRKPPRPRPE